MRVGLMLVQPERIPPPQPPLTFLEFIFQKTLEASNQSRYLTFSLRGQPKEQLRERVRTSPPQPNQSDPMVRSSWLTFM